MNKNKVGAPFRFCDSMIIWMFTLGSDLNLTVRAAAGLAKAILGLASIRAPSYNQFFDRTMDFIGSPDKWEDLRFKFEDFLLVVEVTLSSSVRQEAMGVYQYAITLLMPLMIVKNP